MRFRVALLMSLAALMVVPAGASAAFHLMNVREVFPGDTARPTSQYVELQMYTNGQNQVGGHSVTVYNDLGTENSTAVFPAAVPNGDTQRSILIASPDFEAEFGITPDLVIAAPMMDAAGGAVCFDTIDCVSWGSFGGFDAATPSPVGANALAIPDGSSLERTIAPGCETLLESGDDTDDSATDFAAATPSPRNNATVPTEAPCIVDPPPDKTVTGADLVVKNKQKAKKAVIKGKAGAGEPVSITIKAKKTKGVSFKTANVSVGRRADAANVSFKLKAKGKSKKKLKKLAKRGKKLKVTVKATYEDASGNIDKKKTKVTLK